MATDEGELTLTRAVSRLDYEAMLAYTALPPVGSVLLLILEHKSDYVRFHAWQGALLFTALAVLHLAVSFSRSLSWGLFVVDMVSIAWLSWCAYRDGEFVVPVSGVEEG